MIMDNEIRSVRKEDHDAIRSGYDFVYRMAGKPDGVNGGAPFWFGWALREAFHAGIEFQRQRQATIGSGAKLWLSRCADPNYKHYMVSAGERPPRRADDGHLYQEIAKFSRIIELCPTDFEHATGIHLEPGEAKEITITVGD